MAARKHCVCCPLYKQGTIDMAYRIGGLIKILRKARVWIGEQRAIPGHKSHREALDILSEIDEELPADAIDEGKGGL